VYVHLHGSVHVSVRAVRAVRAVRVAVCGSAAVNVRQCGILWQCARLCEAVHAAVCGSSRGSVW
jgi:hypothetical protein